MQECPTGIWIPQTRSARVENDHTMVITIDETSIGMITQPILPFDLVMVCNYTEDQRITRMCFAQDHRLDCQSVVEKHRELDLLVNLDNPLFATNFIFDIKGKWFSELSEKRRIIIPDTG